MRQSAGRVLRRYGQLFSQGFCHRIGDGVGNHDPANSGAFLAGPAEGPVRSAGHGKVDIGIHYQPNLYLDHEAGIDIVRFGTLVSTPLNTLTVLKDGPIKSVAELKGKRIAFPGKGSPGMPAKEKEDGKFAGTMFKWHTWMGQYIFYLLPVHVGAAPTLAAILEAGLVDGLLSGNALAVHDIEVALYGTSLGVELATGRNAAHGHMHHMRAINAVRRAGSIPAAVADGTLETGVMRACVQAG